MNQSARTQIATMRCILQSKCFSKKLENRSFYVFLRKENAQLRDDFDYKTISKQE